jgi:hypothetical protein
MVVGDERAPNPHESAKRSEAMVESMGWIIFALAGFSRFLRRLCAADTRGAPLAYHYHFAISADRVRYSLSFIISSNTLISCILSTMADIDQECGAATEGQPLLVSTPPKSRFIRFFIVALAVGVTGTLALTKLLHPGTNKVAQLPMTVEEKIEQTPPLTAEEAANYCAALTTQDDCSNSGSKDDSAYCYWGLCSYRVDKTPFGEEACCFDPMVLALQFS